MPENLRQTSASALQKGRNSIGFDESVIKLQAENKCQSGSVRTSLSNKECLNLDGLELRFHALDGAPDGQVNLAGAILHNEASNEAGIELGLQLDVL
jgi:hypothetical protein